MKLILKIIFCFTLLFGCFSSALLVIDKSYCFFNDCNKVAAGGDVFIFGILFVILTYILVDFFKKPVGDSIVDSYIKFEEELPAHMFLDFLFLMSILVFLKSLFPELHSAFFKEFHNIFYGELPWYVRVPILLVIFFVFTIARLMLLKLSMSTENSEVKESVNSQ